MRVNTDEIQDVLRGLKYNQHQKRMIITVLTEYPELIQKLKKLKGKAKSVSLAYDHYLTAPKIVMKEDDTAIIYFNK